MKKNIAVLLAALFLMIQPGLALMKYLTLETLVKQADAIVVGKVAQISCFWNENKTKIFTQISVESQKSLKGNLPAVFTVITQGGQIGELGLWVSDQPRFQMNEKVILFLKLGKSQRQEVLGLEQGKFKVIKEKTSKEEFVAMPKFQALTSNHQISVFPAEKIPLEEFIKTIEKLK